jgi:hypothetical protein
VTVVLSTRDRSISKRGKERNHCKIKNLGEREDKLAIQLMREGLESYGPFGSKGRDRVIVSSYETLMFMKNDYLFGLYKQLRIDSSYVPSFVDGDKNYVTDAIEANLDNYTVATVGSPRHNVLARTPGMNDINPNTSILPKKSIIVVGLERFGGAFFSTVLAKAVSTNGEDVEIQHISLPHGLTCVEKNEINATVVDAMVPSDCFRYENKKLNENKLKDIDSLIAKKCQNEVHISEENNIKGHQWSCGAKCGVGQLNGFALYPDKFYVNITNHIEWYLSRGVDAKVVFLLRDRTISNKEKRRDHSHCNLPQEEADAEGDVIALQIIKEAYRKYGKIGTSLSARSDNEKVMLVSYEGLMQLRQSYLFGIYRSLGINSNYVPDFVDENMKYVAPKS